MNVKLRNLGALCKLVNNHYTVPMSIPKCDSAVETKLESFTNVCIRKYTSLNCNGSIKKNIFRGSSSVKRSVKRSVNMNCFESEWLPSPEFFSASIAW